MSRAISNVFLTVHGVEGEQTPGQAQRRDHSLGGWNLVALFGNRQMAENDMAVGGKGALNRPWFAGGQAAVRNLFFIHSSTGQLLIAGGGCYIRPENRMGACGRSSLP